MRTSRRGDGVGGEELGERKKGSSEFSPHCGPLVRFSSGATRASYHFPCVTVYIDSSCKTHSSRQSRPSLTDKHAEKSCELELI